MHAAAVLEDPGQPGAGSRPCTPGPGASGRPLQRDRQGHLREVLQQDRTASLEHGGGQPGAGRLLVQALRAGGRGQGRHERTDQHAQRVQRPLHRAGQRARRCTPQPALRPGARSRCPCRVGPTTRAAENQNFVRRRSPWRRRSAPPSPICGTGWPGRAARTSLSMAQAIRREHRRRVHHHDVGPHPSLMAHEYGRRARPGVADGRGAGHHAGHDRQRRRLPQRPRGRVDQPAQRSADPGQGHQLPGVQRQPGDQQATRPPPAAVRDVPGRQRRCTAPPPAPR